MRAAVLPQRHGTSGSSAGVRAPMLLRWIAALLVAIAAASPWGNKPLEAALPFQRAFYAWLMPEFRVYEFGLVQSAGHLKVQALAVSHRYLSLQGQAIAPGLGLSGQTPARMALTYAAVVLIGSSLLVRGTPARSALAIALAGALAAVMFSVITPLILVGQQWATVVEPFSEPSAAALLGGVSGALLHGGGYGLAALCVLLVRLVARGSLAEIRHRRQS